MKHERVYGEKEVHKMVAKITVEAFKSGFDQGYKLATDEALRLVREAFPDELEVAERSVGHLIDEIVKDPNFTDSFTET